MAWCWLMGCWRHPPSTVAAITSLDPTLSPILTTPPTLITPTTTNLVGSVYEFEAHFQALVRFLSLPNRQQARYAAASYRTSLVLLSDLQLTEVFNRIEQKHWGWQTDCYLALVTVAQLANLAYYLEQHFHDAATYDVITIRCKLQNYLQQRLDNLGNPKGWPSCSTFDVVYNH